MKQVYKKFGPATIVAALSIMVGPVQADATEDAVNAYVETLKDECDDLEREKPQSTSYVDKGTGGVKDQSYTIVTVPCNTGAYNLINIWLVVTPNGTVKRARFSVPKIDVVYQGDGDNATVKRINILGYFVQSELINSGFQKETGLLFSFSKWRGLADASSHGTWKFSGGDFVLKKYEVDATYNGKMDPITIFDATSTQPKQ